MLDNCEHLVAACARLAGQLLARCPHLKIVATSRERLGIAGEQVWPVPGLSVPEPERESPAELRQQEAARLFVERAGAVRPDFALRAENAVAVAAICRRLDGLPLAIELAAARANVLPVAQIAARLDDTFRLLTAGSRGALPRHQTLRAAIDWSYELLVPEERALLRRLAVFAGGWTLEAAERICAGDGLERRDVFPLLARLVEKSLVEVARAEQTGGAGTRYRLLQTIQQYGREQLRGAPEASRLQDRHLDYFAQLVQAAQPHLGYFLTDTEMDVWRGRLEAEQDNLRAALRWSLAKENGAAAAVEAGLRLASNLHWLWFARGHFAEGRAWLQQLLAASSAVAPEVRAQALLTAGYTACWQGDFTAGGAPLEEALSLFRRLEDGRGIIFAQHGLGFVALGQGNAPLSRALLEGAVRGARDLDDPWLTSFAKHFLAIVLTYQGEVEQAAASFHEGNDLLRELGGHRQGLAFSLFHLARIARLQGDYAAARTRHREGLQLFQEVDDRRGTGYSLAGLAVLAAAQGNLERAARLSGAVAAIEALLGSFLEAPLQVEYDRELAAVRARLGEEAFERARTAGRSMALEQAIAYALDAEGG